MKLTKALKILTSQSMLDWAMLKEAICSCAIEGIKSQELNKSLNAWLKGTATNEQIIKLAEFVSLE